MATVERFVCDVPGCGKAFDTQESFAGHIGFHKLQGSYPCPECERVFTLPQTLGSHRAAKHGIKGTAQKNVRLRSQRREQGVPAKFPTRAVDVPPLVVELPMPKRNGSDPIAAEIREALAPLVSRYEALQARQVELEAEMEQNTHHLSELWGVLGAVPATTGVPVLSPPPMPLGVQVAFTKKVSDSLKERGEEWLALRKQSFTPTDMARSMGISGSTALNLVADFRDEAKVRLVGKRGRSNTYLSTIGAS